MLVTITGLPRSGTAFLSMLMSLHPDCIGYHELAAYDRNWRDTVKNSPYKYVVDSNTYAALPQYDIEPDKRIYIVNNIDDSMKSTEKACQKVVSFGMFSKLWDMGTTWALFSNCYVIGRDDVFTLEGCCKLWHYVFESDAPVDKIAQLIKLNVQHHNAHIVFGEGKEFVL